jgi:hypothetical protein
MRLYYTPEIASYRDPEKPCGGVSVLHCTGRERRDQYVSEWISKYWRMKRLMRAKAGNARVNAQTGGRAMPFPGSSCPWWAEALQGRVKTRESEI